MLTLCFRGVIALLCLICLMSFAQAEDNIGQQQAADEDGADEFFRHGRQFYRFGRAFSPLWDNEDSALIRKNHLLRFPGYPISPVLDNDAFSRSNREFYRFGRAYPPYQDKRFLRFGRSSQTESDEYPRVVLLQSDNQLYRKRRSPKSDNQSGSGESNHKSESVESTPGKDVKKRATTPDETQSTHELSYNSDSFDEKDLEKRFMRFGRGDEEDENEEKRFMRFGKSADFDGNFDKRFMRFGKRFMRFGRGYELAENSPASDDKEVADKRFMRFGKRSKRESTNKQSNNVEASTES